MSMSLPEAMALLGEARNKAEEAAVIMQSARAHLGEVFTALKAVEASGISPGRMPSTIMLASESHEICEDLANRTYSLFQGINEILQ